MRSRLTHHKSRAFALALSSILSCSIAAQTWSSSFIYKERLGGGRRARRCGRGSGLLMAVVVLIGLLVLRPEVACAQSANDGFDPNADASVFCIAVQADGRILVGGQFIQLGGQDRNFIGRVNSDGSLDTSFNLAANNRVDVIALQPDGKILVGGDFTQLGGQSRNFIGRLNPNGSIDTSFNPGADGEVAAIAVQADGKILVGGLFTQLGGQTRIGIGRLNPDGSPDTGFDPGRNGAVVALAVQADGKILLGGQFTQLNDQSRNNIGRLNPDGSLDNTFNLGTNNIVRALAVQPDGKILLGGFFTQLGAQTRNRIGRLNQDGSLDISFNPGANGGVIAVTVQADGKILLGGDFTQLGGQSRNNIGRLNPDGSLDTSFNSGANNVVRAIAVQADGKILLGGQFTQLGGQTRNRIGRLNSDGSLDTSFNPMVNNLVLALAVQADGKILLGGFFTQLGGQTRNRIGRLNPDSSLDTGFNPNANDAVRAILVQADGKILLGGSFTQLGGQGRNRIARLKSDGSLDPSFNAGTNEFVLALAVQGDGKILLGGIFTELNGQPHFFIGRLNPDGSLDSGFNLRADNAVNAIAVQADGKILLGGDFTQLDGQSHNHIGRLNPDGSVDTSFNPVANNAVQTLAVQADGKILLGGTFTQLGGQSRNRIGRLNQDGSLDNSFNPSVFGSDITTVNTLAVQADGKILVGGRFNLFMGELRFAMGRLNPDGSLDTNFDPGTNDEVDAIAVQADGKILVAGSFTQLGGQTRIGIGRLTNTDAALQNVSVSPDGTAIQWLRSGASPEVSRVTIEASTNGRNYFLIGSAIRIAGGWQLTGLSLPRGQNIFIRTRGFYATGFFGGSGSVVESVRNVFLSGATPICPGAPGGIISWWPAENNAQDVVSHYDGTLQNGATFATGLVNQAFSLDGIDDAIVVNNNLGLNPTSITIEAWVNPDSVPAGALKDVVTKWGFDSARDSYLLGLINNGSGIAVIGGIGDGETGDPGLSGGIVSLKKWNHIAMTYDAASGLHRLYLNGMQVNQRVRANGIFPTTSRVFIGSEDSNQSRFFSGLIDEPTIFARALTDAEIFAIFNAGRNAKCPTIQFTASSFNALESVGSMSVHVTRTGDTSGTSTVAYTTGDAAGANLCNVVNGQASSRCDYETTLGTLTFAPGETSKTILVPIVDDVFVDGNENLTLTLSNATGATLGAPATATLTIMDNDSPGAANPIDTTSFFVRQHYIDFFTREPDSGGLNFWIGEIDNCTPKPQCTEVKRINVSAAFFLSIEFQETGYLVYRMYKTAFGTPAGSPVPVTFTPFLHDTQQIGKGVIVGVGNWEAQLEANKQAFALAFVQRPEFLTAFPNGMSASAFVDQMNTNAGGVLSPAERNNLIGMLTNPNDAGQRAQVLRQMAENKTLHDAEFNKAFVLMQYFGYLRRNPNDPGLNGQPDPNFLGFNFWLNKLNEFDGNFINAEMVKSFIVSIEYRQRFGP